MAGRSFNSVARIRCAAAPVMVMSAFPAFEESTSQFHVEARLAKPFDLDDLVGAVKRLLDPADGDP